MVETVRTVVFWCGVYWLCGHIRDAARWIKTEVPYHVRHWRRTRTERQAKQPDAAE